MKHHRLPPTRLFYSENSRFVLPLRSSARYDKVLRHLRWRQGAHKTGGAKRNRNLGHNSARDTLLCAKNPTRPVRHPAPHRLTDRSEIAIFDRNYAYGFFFLQMVGIVVRIWKIDWTSRESSVNRCGVYRLAFVASKLVFEWDMIID